MSRLFACTDGGASYLLQEQKPAGRELIVGSSSAPGLGALVMVGLGGALVEIIKDVAVAVAPVHRLDAREMMRLLKGCAVLEGWRAAPGVDMAALEDLICRVSQLAADFPSICEMDLNPVLAYPAGTAPAAVDVRIKVA
jgi:acyl-CoA synthetase (NDP forming)